MAVVTFDQIVSVRTQIVDPQCYNNFIAVADRSSLPGTPGKKTAYKLLDEDIYVAWDETAGFTENEGGGSTPVWKEVNTELSDAFISEMISAFGITGAVRKSLRNIRARLIRSWNDLKSTKSGADEVTWKNLADLKNLIDFYDTLIAEAGLDDSDSATTLNPRAGYRDSMWKHRPGGCWL